MPTTCLNAVVERGKVITAAGVSSGIDMGLVLVDRLFGPERAQLIQLAIEYDPQPPFDAGSPTKAPKDIVDVARPLLADTLSDAVSISQRVPRTAGSEGLPRRRTGQRRGWRRRHPQAAS